jgi:hypothetical protein
VHRLPHSILEHLYHPQKKKKPWWAQWLTLVIRATQEVEGWRIMIWGQPKQKVGKTPSQSITRVWWCMPVVSACFIFLPVPELFHLMPSASMQTDINNRISSFLWLNSIPLHIYIYVYTPHFFYPLICQWTQADVMSWLLWRVLSRT